jgi:hypothetical protein
VRAEVNSARIVWEEDHLPMRTATEWLKKRSKKRIVPTEETFLEWDGVGTMGMGPDGSVLVEDEDGLYLLANDYAESLSEDIMADISRLLGIGSARERTAEEFWKLQLDRAKTKPGSIKVEVMSIVPQAPKDPQVNNTTFSINTMHKKKAQKVQPVDDSGQKTRTIEGRLDWKERAMAKQIPEADSTSAAFGTLFEPRYADFPRGTRMTPERIKEMKISPDLQPEERRMLLEVLYRREAALAWDFKESGRISREVIPPVVIDTVPHQAWRADQFPIPRKLRDVVIEMVKERIARGTLELCKSQYRNPWFLVAKKDKGYRLINNAQKINGVTIRDANPPPNPDEFSEEFAGCVIMSLLDFFSGYDQVELHEDSRDITAFYTPLGLVRQCTLPMGTTNSVAEFVRVMTKICQDHIPHRCMPYLDDVCIKGPKNDYQGEEALPGIRLFVAEHLSNMDQVLADIERAGATISGHKSDFGYASMVVVGYRIDAAGRHPDQKKVDKILSWPACKGVKDVRTFLGVCVYYRIWIIGFAIIAEPLFRLLRKDAHFQWEDEQRSAMKQLKEALCSAPALISIDYTMPMKPLIVAVDGSKKGWGAVIMQVDVSGHRHPARYESGSWSKSERNWDSGKHECKALLLALKKFRSYLYGTRFTVETDAKTLVAQLQRSATDLPGALVTRWLALLNLWDFDIVHVAGKKNVVADALSRRPEEDGWEPPEEAEEDVEDFIDAHLNSARLILGPAAPCTLALQYGSCPVNLSFDSTPLDPTYNAESQEIATWILFRKRPERLSQSEFIRFKRKALRMTVRERHLFTLPSGGRPLRRIVDDKNEQLEIIKAMHDDSGHRGKEGTWRKVWSRYHWKGQYEHVKQYVATCIPCQVHASATMKEELWPQDPPRMLFGSISVDVVYMPPGLNGKRFLVCARCAATQWPEARGLVKNDAASVLRFLEQDVFCRWGLPLRMTVDGGPENKGLVNDFQRQFGINRVVASAYHPEGQGMIERGHAPLVAALKKMPGNWVNNLSLVLWADRVTVKRSTNETPAYMVSGREHILPVELSIPTWQVLPWDTVTDTASLLEMRARQFEKRDARFKEAINRTVRLRHDNKDYFDDSRVVRTTKLQAGDSVLLRDSFHENDRSTLTKFLPKWQGPFRIRKANEKGWYNLEELDGTPFRSHTPGTRLKQFRQRTTVDLKKADAHWAKIEEQRRVEQLSDNEQDPEIENTEPSYGQDIPELRQTPSSEQPIIEATRETRSRAAKRIMEEEAAAIDADEESDLERMHTISDLERIRVLPRTAIAVKPKRREGFNPAEYQMYE